MKCNDSVVMAPGTYFLADPCYAVPDDLWTELLDSCDYFKEPVGKVTKDGVEYSVLGFSTAYGDGCYVGSDGFSYGVDAGLIGLVPKALCSGDEFTETLGTWITFTEPTECLNHDGVMMFGELVIDTLCDEDDWSDEYSPEWDEDDE